MIRTPNAGSTHMTVLKSKLILLLLAAGALVLTGCSSVRTKVDTGPIRAATFSFVNRGPNPPALGEDWGRLHTLIQGAITRNLAGRGVAQVASASDVVAAYLVVVGNGVVTTANADYFGDGRDTAGLRDKAHEAYTGSKNPNYFEAGTLLVDLIDAKTYKVLRRNHVVRPILRDATANVQAYRIQEAVDDVLKDLRIAR